MQVNKQLGSILMIAGTTIGAGILALPMVSAGQGFPYATLVLIALWALMLYGALLTLEVNLTFHHGASFSTLGKKTLGRAGQLTINACMISLFYCLTAAYISGGADFLHTDLQHYLQWPVARPWCALLFTVALGSLVVWKTSAVDLANRLLLTIKMIAFLSVTFLLVPHVNYQQLQLQPENQRFVWMSLPIFFTAFGFHGSIPSIIKYVGHHPRTLRRIFLLGSFIPLILYLLWEMVTLGILPRSGTPSFANLAAQHGSVAMFISELSSMLNTDYVRYGVNFFTDVAMTTSFLGVTLGLFDFFADLFKAKPQLSHRLGLGLVTFAPPFLFALFYPQGFITALGYAAIPLALLAIVLPSLMAFKTRRQTTHQYPYRVAGGALGLGVMVAAGLLIIGLQLLLISGKLPVFGQ